MHEAAPGQPPEPRMLALSADYSDDELDAIAELFDRPRLRRRREPADRDERLRRAVADAAIRALVARHAVVLEGSAAKPRVRLLEPHRSLLDPFVHATATIGVRVDRPGLSVTRSFFMRDDVVVVQEALAGQAIKRMVLHPATEAQARLLDGIPEPDHAAVQHAACAPIELTMRMLAGAERAVAEGTPPPECVPSRAVDLLHARLATVTVTTTTREPDGTVETERRSWLDAGTLGTWEIVPGAGDPPATVVLEPRDGNALRGWLVSAAAGPSA